MAKSLGKGYFSVMRPWLEECSLLTVKKAEWLIDRETRAETDSILWSNKTPKKKIYKAERNWCELIHGNVNVAEAEGKSSSDNLSKGSSSSASLSQLISNHLILNKILFLEIF